MRYAPEKNVQATSHFRWIFKEHLYPGYCDCKHKLSWAAKTFSGLCNNCVRHRVKKCQREKRRNVKESDRKVWASKPQLIYFWIIKNRQSFFQSVKIKGQGTLLLCCETMTFPVAFSNVTASLRCASTDTILNILVDIIRPKRAPLTQWQGTLVGSQSLEEDKAKKTQTFSNQKLEMRKFRRTLNHETYVLISVMSHMKKDAF